MKKENILQLIESIKTLLDIKGVHIQGNDIDDEVIIEGFKFGYNISITIRNDKRSLVDRVIMAQDLRSKGLKIREIANILNVAHSTIYRYLHISITDIENKTQK